MPEELSEKQDEIVVALGAFFAAQDIALDAENPISARAYFFGIARVNAEKVKALVDASLQENLDTLKHAIVSKREA